MSKPGSQWKQLLSNKEAVCHMTPKHYRSMPCIEMKHFSYNRLGESE